jgi:hypothetical protein
LSLVILIPTFKRPATLYWSLKSVLTQKFGEVNFKKSVHILNNDPNTKHEVNITVRNLLEELNGHQFDSVEISQGDVNLPTIKKIYSYLNAITNSNDIAIIHGDDDIMLDNTLLKRYLAALNSDSCVTISKAIGTCYFISNKNGIYIDSILNKIGSKNNKIEYLKAKKTDLTDYSIPFFSVYNYKIGIEFWKIYNQAISWADELPFQPNIKYPFVPFFIGLSAYYNNQLSTSIPEVVIRGQYIKKNIILPPTVITEYANTGIIMLTGLSILRNSSLINKCDYDKIRFEFEKNSNDFLLQTFFKRDGMSLRDLKILFKIAKVNISFINILKNINFTSLRNLFNNIVFDTKYIKKKFIGWGTLTNNVDFWNLLKNNAK